MRSPDARQTRLALNSLIALVAVAAFVVVAVITLHPRLWLFADSSAPGGFRAIFAFRSDCQSGPDAFKFGVTASRPPASPRTPPRAACSPGPGSRRRDSPRLI